MQILLGKEAVNPNKPNTKGNTPLLFATLNAYEAVVKILLKRDDINPDT